MHRHSCWECIYMHSWAGQLEYPVFDPAGLQRQQFHAPQHVVQVMLELHIQVYPRSSSASGDGSGGSKSVLTIQPGNQPANQPSSQPTSQPASQPSQPANPAQPNLPPTSHPGGVFLTDRYGKKTRGGGSLVIPTAFKTQVLCFCF